MFHASIGIQWRFLPAGHHAAESPPCSGSKRRPKCCHKAVGRAERDSLQFNTKAARRSLAALLML
jgi:hypothetical protein